MLGVPTYVKPLRGKRQTPGFSAAREDGIAGRSGLYDRFGDAGEVSGADIGASASWRAAPVVLG